MRMSEESHDARRLREIEFLRKEGLATFDDEYEARAIKRKLALQRFDEQESKRGR